MKCEYAVVSVSGTLFGSKVTIHWPNGSSNEQNNNPLVVLNQMAAQGWEVVASTANGSMASWTLKRPLPERISV